VILYTLDEKIYYIINFLYHHIIFFIYCQFKLRFLIIFMEVITMSFDLMLFGGSMVQKQAVSEILEINKITEQFGLTLTEHQALELVETRSYALKNTGRIEFGGGVLDKIIKSFCDSPYISHYNYQEVLHELVEIFYYYKNETLDQMSDDDLILTMKKHFNGKCEGSLDLLKCRELEKMARNLRNGYDPEYEEIDARVAEEKNNAVY